MSQNGLPGTAGVDGSNERPHHQYSPSTLQNLEACPSYQSRSTANVRAVIGTMAHKVAETGIDDNRLDDADAERAAAAMDFWHKRLLLMKGLSLAHTQEDKVEEFKEAYLPIDEVTWTETRLIPPAIAEGEGRWVKETYTVQATTAGYVDCGAIDHTGEYAELLDYKFGFWAVEKAESNLQGIAYSLGLFKRHPKLKSIRFFFFQPGLSLTPDEAVFTREQIPALYLRVQTVVARAREARAAGDFSTANPTVPVCNFCANLGKCPKVLSIALNTAKKFSPLDVPEHITPTMVLDPHQTALALKLASVVKTWAEAFRSQTTDRVLRRQADLPEGYKIVTQQERSVVNPEAFRACALKVLTGEEYEKLKDVPGFGAIENAIKEKSPRGHKKSAIDAFKADLEQSGAVEKGLPFSFLKAESSTKKDQ